MDSDEGKLFIGGVAWDTTEETLREHFNQYGEVTQTVIMRDKTTGRPRGFAFVVFSDPSVLDRVLQDKHNIDGRTVEAKRALSREEQNASSRSGSFNSGRSSGGGGNFRTKKIFVGGLPSTLTEDGFHQYFESYGHVADVVMMYDQNTQRPRGFGFITFDSEEAVDRVLHKSFHELDGKLVEVKRALPKDANPGGGSRGGHQGYGASGANTNTFDGHGDSTRYLQPQSTAGGFPPYSSFIPPSYGYGAANSAMSYAGYGGYGVGGYGSTNSGFGGPAGAYGNPNAPSAGYVSGPPGALKNTWSNQTPSGYGVSGYGANAGYGYTAPWSVPGGGAAVTAARGQSPGGAYGGRGGYAENNNAGGGFSGGEQQGSGGGYMESGYGESHGKSGYSSENWRSDPSQATGGYGGGYGGAQSRQA
ncbi:Heterogeneous nuclear ribonucleoprotein 1 [Quillaja saponaria]|uniref:Heterogeneous nuclear ribonucleoprotein 1 n=1 Tax=Quillaja saponaria TaxID=32244 RepID=A0AAD7Q0M0_QUISA|nr:Heterogeneous nuclear ribonucleoprotein 1 [Quillaja saponaria]